MIQLYIYVYRKVNMNILVLISDYAFEYTRFKTINLQSHI